MSQPPHLNDDARHAPELPAWLPHLIFAALTAVLFRDFIFSGAMLFGVDTEAMGYMARAFYAQELAEGNFPGWAPLLLGGTPFLASLAGGDSLYPPSLFLLLFLEPYRALGWKLVLHVFLAGVGMYGWTRALGVSRAAATIAGAGYLVAPFLVTLVYPGHDGKLFVTALAPFLFWATEAWFRGGGGRAWAGIAAVVALVTLTTHFQMAYFLFGGVGAFALFRTVQGMRATSGGAEEEALEEARDNAPPAARRRGRAPLATFGLFLAASVAGVGVAAVQFVPALDYITEFSRRTATTTEASAEENKLYASSWSLHPEEGMSLLIPEFVGNNSNGSPWTSGTYWGRNPFKLNHEYLGLGLLILAGLAFLGGPRVGVRRFFLGLGLVTFLYALGAHTPVWHLFFAVLPGIKLFRAPSMAIFLTGMSVATLAALGADRLFAWMDDARAEDRAATAQKVLWGVLGATVVLMLLSAGNVLTELWTGVFAVELSPGKTAALEAARPFVARGALLAVVVATGVALALFLGRKGTLPPTGVAALLLVVVAVDGARVSSPFLQTRSFSEFDSRGANIDALLQRQAAESPFRVLDLSEPQIGQGVRPAMYGLELASGHHPNDMARFRELTGMVGSGMPENLVRSPGVAAMLNVRYIIWPARQFGPAQGLEPVSATQFSNGELFEAVYRVPDLPRARLVAQVEVVPDEQAVARLTDPAFPVASTVTVPEPLPGGLGGGEPQGDVSWVRRETDELELRVTSDRDALLVIADNWHPGWRAEVDGVEAPVHRVNHTLRGVPVSAGTHSVVLTFQPSAVRLGLLLSGVSTLLLLGVVGSTFRRDNERETPPDGA